MKMTAVLALTAALMMCGCSSTNEQTTPRETPAPEPVEIVEVEPEPQEADVEALPLPSYQDFLGTIDKRNGQVYEIQGRVTNVSGGFRGADYMVYVFWDESETNGEVAAVRIPYESYTKSVNRYFEGNCKLEGLDDRGRPQFVCDSYIAERP